MSYQAKKQSLLRIIASMVPGTIFTIGSVDHGEYAREILLGRYLTKHLQQLSLKIVGDCYGSNLYEKI